MRLLFASLLLLCGLGSPGAWGQIATPAASPATPPPAATLTPAQAQAVLDVLQDDKKRAQFETVLQSMIRTVPATQPAPVVPLVANSVGAQLLVEGEHWAAQTGSQLRTTVLAVGGLPLLWRWMLSVVQNPDNVTSLLDTLWKVAVIALLGAAAERAAAWLLRRVRAILLSRAPPDDTASVDTASVDGATEPSQRRRFSIAWRTLKRLPFVLAVLVLELIPVAVFAAVGNGLLATPLGDTTNTRLVVLGLVDAYVICRVILCVMRAFVSPRSNRLRLVQCDDATAVYIERWTRRLAAVAVFGYAIPEVALLFGLTRPAYDVLVKLVALVVHAMLVVVVLQLRHSVAARLRARRTASGVLANLQNYLAASWHRVAIFYIIALWLVAAAEIRDGYSRLLHFFVVTMATLVTARLIGIVVVGTLDRTLRSDADPASQHPAIDQRIVHYYPAIRLSLIAGLWAATMIVLLEGWGFSPLSWFSFGQLGARLLGALLTSGVTIVAAVVVWEVVNASIEAKVDALTRAAQTARAARLRTLLPMLRTALLVALVILAGLVVLSQVGVNISPLLAGAGVLGVAIGFGSQKLVQDLITGLFLLLENTMQVGDVVTLAGLMGTVEYLSIRTIRLRAQDGSMHIIPFSSVTTVTNQTRDFAYALVDLPIGLDEQPDRVADLLAGIVKDMRAEPRWEDSITADLEVMGVYAFTDTAWTMRVRIRTTASQRWVVNREFNRRVKYCFDQNAVQSPITSYRVQGWLPPGAERPIPRPPPPPAPDPEPEPGPLQAVIATHMQDAAQ